ncbi:polysaccharide biosynthesis C-terminal domain-containing protein [Vibrio harveyi]
MKRLLESIFYLAVVKVVRLIIPLILIPILSTKLSSEYLSFYFIANLVAAWTAILIDYGYDYSAVRRLAGKVDNQLYVARTFIGVTSVKLFLGFIAVFISAGLLLTDSDKNKFIFVGVLLGFSQAMTPVWFYMAHEKLKNIGLSTLIVNLIFLFVALKVESDHQLLTSLYLLIALRFAASVILSIRYIGLMLKMKVKLEFRNVVRYLYWGFPMFKFQALASVYTTFPGFYFSSFGSSAGIISYGVADRVTKAGGAALSPIIQAIYPFVCKLSNQGDGDLARIKSRLKIMQLALSFGCALVLSCFSEKIAQILIGEQIGNAPELIRILVWSLLLVSISNIYGVQGLLVEGHEKEFNRAILVATLAHIPILILLVDRLDAFGAVISIVITELLVTLLMFYFYRRKRSV